MDLSKEIIQQFIDVTTQDKEVQNGVTLYGTIKTQGSEKFVMLDGSDQLTPIKSTTFVSDGERVTVMIKNHQAIVTGNITSPAARQPDVDDTVGDKISEYDVIITKTIEAQDAKIGDLVAQNVEITGDLTAVNGTIEQLKSENVEITGKLDANEAEIKKLKTDKLDADTADIKFATIENLKATNIEVNTIKGNHADFAELTTQKFEAVNANIQNLEVNKLSASEADLKYANIDFANIGKAAIEHLFAQSGLIKDLVVGDQHITGELVGVTIKGDLIEGGTIIADKLVVKGSDGLYYKLNTDGMKVEAEQTEYNSLNGSIITAKSITATKVNVDDLVAFDATIGGFKITDNSIHSGVKSSVDNTTRGIYLDNTGQVAFGDGNSFLKYFKDSDGKWKLVVSANSVKLSTSNTTVEDALDDMNNKIDNTTKSIEEHFAVSNDPTTVPTSGWSTTPPVWQNGKYIWSKMITTYVDGRISESKPVCITGAKGQDGTSGSAGKGIKTVTNYYLATNTNTGVTENTSGWTEAVQTITSTKKYLWNYEKITYTDNSTTTTTPVIIGVYGDKGQTGATGATGNGIKTITEYYLVSSSSSGVTTSTSGWSTTIPTLTATNKYLWNYEVIAYTNGSSSTGSPKIIGVYGDKGNTGATGPTGPAGVGIKSVDVEYYLSTSSTTQSGGSWSTTAPTWVNGKYMWSRTKTVTTDGTTKYSSPACITGQKGSTGATGNTGATGATGPTGATGQGVQSITEEYYLSTSKTSQSGGSWVTTPPTWSTGKYMWTRSKIVYKNPTSTVYTTPVCDSSWEAVNEIEVGGRNLFLYTADYRKAPSGYYAPSAISAINDTFNGNTIYRSNVAWASLRVFFNKHVIDRGLAKVGDKFTISIYMKTDDTEDKFVRLYYRTSTNSSGYNFPDTTNIKLSSDWKQVTHTFTVTEQMLTTDYITFMGFEPITTCTSGKYVYHTSPKIERGNKATDWTPAPEDIDSTFDGVYDLITDKEVKITQSYQTDLQLLEKNIQLSVSETYAEKSAVSTIEKNLASKIDQTAKDVTINFNKVNNETRGELQNFKTEVNSYIKFDEDGMELGKSNSKFKTKLTNEKLAFLEDGSEIASISNKEMSITDANITNQLTIGKFAFVPRSNGNTSLKWIG